MKCFNHQTVDAVGICVICGRSLCKDCITEVNHSVVCRDRCEECKIQMDRSNLCNLTLMNKFASVYGITALIYLLIGMILLIAGFTFRSIMGIFIIIPLGIIFMISSILQYTAAKKFINNG